jgi:hypothetical protein
VSYTSPTTLNAMPQITSVYLEHQLKRWMRPDADRFIRPDWRRYVRPGFEEDHPFACYERKYSPEQPRVPAGSREGGQWRDADSSSSGQARIYVGAGLPKIPRQRPPTSGERTAIAKTIAAFLAEKGIAGAGEFIAKSSWLYNAIPYINSYLDAPKSLEELQAGVSTSRLGYDVHHIVEQSGAAEAGYPRQMIDAPDNLVRVPRIRHWEINAWYQTRNPNYGDVSPREYLSGKDWDERRRVGLEALIRSGVLKR